MDFSCHELVTLTGPLKAHCFKGILVTIFNACQLHCNTLQHTATHCNALQRTATHCNKLHHTATHCNTPVN